MDFTDVFCRHDDFTRRLRTFTWRISRILDTVGGLFGRVLLSGRFYATCTDVYVEDFAHFGHRRRLYERVSPFGGLYATFTGVYGRLRGGLRAL